MQHHDQLVAEHPEMAARLAAIEQRTAQSLAAGSAAASTIKRIPVVVHVLWNSAAQNIGDAQIQSQMTALNQDFRRTNPDAASTLAQFLGVATDCTIEFCLATVDPSGQPATGITRTQTWRTSFDPNGSTMKYTAQGGRDAWPASNYMNVWVCNLSGGILGFAQFPGGPSATDGIVVTYTAFGTTGTAQYPFHLGRTLTHEVGHWLNLRHIWGDAQPSCGDDFVADTPPANGPHFECTTSASSCSGLNMVQNYMDYTDDACMNLFTAGQRDRMLALLASGGARASLMSSPAGCPNPSPAFQLNQDASSLTFDAVAGSSSAGAVLSVAAGAPFDVAFGADAAGRPWEVLITFASLVAADEGGITTAGGQIVNLSFAAPFVWLWGGAAPALAPFPGDFSLPAAIGASGQLAAQQIVITPAVAEGFALSQGCGLVVAVP
jgi:hypothetical protein